MQQDLTERIVRASEKGDLEAVKAALAEGASPDAMGENSGALHEAAYGGHEAVVELLLAYSANPNHVDKQGHYPLQLAASKNHARVMQLLIEKGADLEAKTSQEGTALHVAAASGTAVAAAVLLKAGAKLEARDAGGNTPLATALSLGQAQVARLLLQANADLHTLNDTQETVLIHLARGLKGVQVKKWATNGEDKGVPIQYRIEKGYFTCTKGDSTLELPLEEQRYSANQELGPSGHLDYLHACDLFMELVNIGMDVDAVGQDGHSVLGLVCHTGEPRLIRLLMEKGTSRVVRHPKGIGPLHLVAGSGRLDGLATFLELAGDFDVNARDAYGWTALHYLADLGGDLRMADLLLARGADRGMVTTMERAGIAAGVMPADVARHWRDEAMAARVS